MAVLLTVTGPMGRNTLRFDREIIAVGRDPGNAIALEDPALSRIHCQFEQRQGVLWVRDLNSKNGTWLAGKPVIQAPLKRGDRVCLGKTDILFEGFDPAQGAKEAGWKTIRLLFRPPRLVARKRSLEQENQRLRQLLHLTRELVAELDQQKLLAFLIDTAIDLTDAERGFLLVFRGEDFSVEVARNYWRQDVPEPEIEISHHLAEQVRRERKALIIEDASEDSRFKEFLSVYALKLRSVLCLPLLFRGNVVGVLYLDNRFTRGSFREDEHELLQTFADLGAIALVNSDRFARERQARHALKEQVEKTREEILEARQALQRERGRRLLRYSYDSIVAHSPAMVDLLHLVDRVTPSDLPVLLEGAVGTGKEHLARTMHQNGPRQEAPFVVLVCAALPSSLAELELFGHAAGAFTGAGAAHGGLLEEAHGGTLYLEGIDDLDREAQALFLRILESGEFRRLGERELRRVDLRIMASCTKSLATLVEEGRFREDLYFRLKGVQLSLPTLRERPEDLPELLQRIRSKEGAGLHLTPRARKALLMRPWPGNLVELSNEIKRLATLEQDVVDVEDLAPPGLPEGDTLKEAVVALEKRLILRALQQHAANRTRTAQALGLSRLGLRQKMQRYGLDLPPFDPAR